MQSRHNSICYRKVLDPCHPAMAATLSRSVASWLDKPGAAGWRQDRRENLWGVRTCATIDGECTILGSYTPDPPLAGANVNDSLFVVCSERNNNATFSIQACLIATGESVNHCVPLLLALQLGGDERNASATFKRLLSTWDGVGFGPPKKSAFQAALQSSGSGCHTQSDSLYTTRSFGYFLLAQRAMSWRPGVEVPAATLSAMEAALWKLQVCDPPHGDGLPATYNTAGVPCCADAGLTSIETGALSLLPYDPRVRTTWFPAAKAAARM